MSELIIAGCPVQLQLNGNAVYVVFTANEEQSQGAFMTLYNVNAHSNERMNDGGAFWYTVTTLERLQRGLFNLATLRLLNGDTSAFKGKRGGMWNAAKAMASAMFENAGKCRMVTVQSAVCDALSMGSPYGRWDGDEN